MAAAAGKAADRPDEPVVGSRFSARWRIVTWIMVLLGIVLILTSLVLRYGAELEQKRV